MTINRQILVPLLILVMCVLGCGLFSKSDDAEMVLAATEVGTPQGEKVSKEIGPAGGTLASPDGRMTLTVAANALTETIAFSMQPITNKAGNGLGLAYRLEPNEKTFPKPLEIAVKYDEKDLEGTVPEAFTIAYQDEKGRWQGQTLAKLDKSTKTLTITTSHFTDFAFLARLRMRPPSAKVRLGEGQGVELTICQELGFFDRLRGVDPRDLCDSAPLARSSVWSVSGPGNISDLERDGITTGVMYQAPNEMPPDNVAYVDLEVEFEVRDPASGRMSTVLGKFRTIITIVPYGYKASGQDGPVIYSGTICDLEEPFLVGGVHPLFLLPMHFTPSSGTAGKMKYETSRGGISASGGGSYKIEGLNTDKPRIVMDTESTASILVAKTTGGGKATINLTPIGFGEGCN